MTKEPTRIRATPEGEKGAAVILGVTFALAFLCFAIGIFMVAC